MRKPHANDWLETNLREAIAALHSERYYEFTDGLFMLLDKAKHADRLLWSILSVTAGGSAEDSDARLKQAEQDNDWF